MSRAVAIATALTLALLAIAAWLTTPAHADELLPRGLGHPTGDVHWYDPGCCSMKDCEPVEPGAIREVKGGYLVQYRSSRGFIVRGFLPLGSTAIHPSRDEREHACATAQLLLCIYLPFTM